jgi:hypothetical protein
MLLLSQSSSTVALIQLPHEWPLPLSWCRHMNTSFDRSSYVSMILCYPNKHTEDRCELRAPLAMVLCFLSYYRRQWVTGWQVNNPAIVMVRSLFSQAPGLGFDSLPFTMRQQRNTLGTLLSMSGWFYQYTGLYRTLV